jgi:outer membrane protein OmpU
MDALTVALSAGQLGGVSTALVTADQMSVAVKYSMGDYYAAVGYETAKTGVVPVTTTQTSVALGGNFGPVAAKLVYAKVKGAKAKVAVSGTYKMDAIAVTAFYADKGAADAYGIGASYDLGGGASVVGGISKSKGGKTLSEIGVSMSF